jgi:hypothetical protein
MQREVWATENFFVSLNLATPVLKHTIIQYGRNKFNLNNFLKANGDKKSTKSIESLESRTRTYSNLSGKNKSFFTLSKIVQHENANKFLFSFRIQHNKIKRMTQ